MPKIFYALLFWILILCACSPSGLSPEADPVISTQATATPMENSFPETMMPEEDIIPISTTEVLPLPKLIATVATPHIDPGPNGELPDLPSPTVSPSLDACGYRWAYQDLPELSTQFQASMQTLQLEAQANAFAFGEDCIHADGTSTFLAMETDFNITLQVNDPANENDLGEWIVKTMQVIENLPAEKIVGPRPGRVTIIFVTGTDQKFVNFYVDKYQALEPGLSGAEIYQALQTQQ